MSIKASVVEAIGRTPLIRLKAASEATGCRILGKAEFMNPGGSVKDRAALAIIQDAVARGALRPGGVIVEGTAGNTGIGLGVVGSALGYRTVIVIPDTQTQEKKDMLRLVGAELVEVPAVPYANPNNYVKYSGRLAETLAKTEPNGAIWANQFDNVANRRGHYETTGPEIFEDTGGEVDGFVCAVGSGGTLAGVGMALKERNPGDQDRARRPARRRALSFYTHGVLKRRGLVDHRRHRARAHHGQPRGRAGRLRLPDPDAEAVQIVFDLVEHEGLLLGGSSGVNIAGAIRLARELGPGHTIVTILCDFGARYASKLFNPAFLRSKSLPFPAWLERRDECPRFTSDMTEPLFRDDAYRREAPARVLEPRPAASCSTRRCFTRRAAGSPATAARSSSRTASRRDRQHRL